MSLNSARMPRLSDKHEALEEERLAELSAKEKEEEKIKSSKKPAPKKLKD